MPFSGDMVHYNYGAMAGVASGLHACGATAQALLDAGRANRQVLMSTHTGSAALTFEDSFHKYEQVCQNTIDVTSRGAHAYDNGTMAMQGNEQQMSAAFPG